MSNAARVGFFNGRRQKGQQKQDKQQKKQNNASKNKKSSNNTRPESTRKSSKDSSKWIGTSSNKSNTINNSEPQRRQQKQHDQQEKQHTTRKASIKQQQKIAKTTQKATKAVQTFWKAESGKLGFFTQQTTGTRRPECGGAKPRTINEGQEVCGPKGGGREGREEEECSSRGISVGYRQILSQLVVKNVINILEGQTLRK